MTSSRESVNFLTYPIPSVCCPYDLSHQYGWINSHRRFTAFRFVLPNPRLGCFPIFRCVRHSTELNTMFECRFYSVGAFTTYVSISDILRALNCSVVANYFTVYLFLGETYCVYDVANFALWSAFADDSSVVDNKLSHDFLLRLVWQSRLVQLFLITWSTTPHDQP